MCVCLIGNASDCTSRAGHTHTGCARRGAAAGRLGEFVPTSDAQTDRVIYSHRQPRRNARARPIEIFKWHCRTVSGVVMRVQSVCVCRSARCTHTHTHITHSVCTMHGHIQNAHMHARDAPEVIHLRLNILMFSIDFCHEYAKVFHTLRCSVLNL